MSRGPVILLAFADTRGDLPELREEGRQLQELFEPLHAAGRCQRVVLPFATLDQVYDALQQYRGRVAVFHFGGHADPGRLFLDAALAGAGTGGAAHAGGLAALLGQQHGLKLVFLNGCATRPQVRLLLDAGVPAVVATARPIEDRAAREFAVAFYRALTTGAGVAGAFAAAEALTAARQGGETGASTPARSMTTGSLGAADVADDRGRPWGLQIRKGSEAVERWHPFDEDPLFGLPGLPDDIPVPLEPFRRLEWFGREHARIFFGRGRAIRELYELVTRPLAPADARVVLYYGQTGVGKTSVLAAGLLPRLEASHAVRYLRRTSDQGLLGTLRSALENGTHTFELGEAWVGAERGAGREAGCPLVIVLDQAEEAYTRPLAGATGGPDDEVRTLAEAVRDAFGPARADRPRGRLILSFRKEWLAEFQRAFQAVGVAPERVPLSPLDRAGVAEAVEGPAGVPQYRLTVKPSRAEVENGDPPLAEFVADDLLAALADPRANSLSPVAPTLQILLTRMWAEACARNDDKPTFDRPLYTHLKAQGFHLDEVLDQQLELISREDPEAVRTGLVLDLLDHFTTTLGTATVRTRAEVIDRYPRQIPERVTALLRLCQNRYLLTEVGAGAGDKTVYRLVHDTLAPLVRDRWNRSLDPGPRATRTLGKRALEWANGKIGPPLDRHDLATVEAAAPVMPRWTNDEERVLAASRAAEAQRIEEERRRQEEKDASNRRLRHGAYALAVMLVATVAVAAVAVGQWRSAKKAEGDAKTAQGQTQNTLARSFVRSLGQRSGEESLNRVEVDALWDLASLQAADEPVRFAFLQQVLTDTTTATRLENKMPFAAWAAVDLAPERRERALREIVLPAFRTSESSSQVRLAAVAAGVALEATDPEFLNAAAAVMEDAVRDDLLGRSRFLNNAALDGLQSSDRARVELFFSLRAITTERQEGDSGLRAEARQRLERVAVAVMGRAIQRRDWSHVQELSTRLGGEVAPLVVERMRDEKDGRELSNLGQAVVALAKQMKGADAAPLAKSAAEILVEHIRNEKERDGSTLLALGQRVADLAHWLKDADTSHLAEKSLVSIIGRVNGGSYIHDYLISKLDDEGAARLASFLVARTQNETDVGTLNNLEGLVIASAGGMKDTGTARQLAQILIERMGTSRDEKDWHALLSLGRMATALVKRVKDADAASLAKSAASILVDRMRNEKERDGDMLFNLSWVVADLALRMNDTDAASLAEGAADILAKGMQDEKNGLRLGGIGHQLAALTKRMNDTDATPLIESAITVLIARARIEEDGIALTNLGAAIKNLAERVKGISNARLTSLLVERIHDEKDGRAVSNLSRVIGILVAPAKDAAPLTEKVATVLVKRVATEKDEKVLGGLGEIVAVLASQMKEVDATQLVPLLVDRMRTVQDGNVFNNLEHAIAALAPQAKDVEASRLALLLVNRMGGEKDEKVLSSLGHAVAALAKRMKDADAVPLVERAAEAVIKSTSTVKDGNFGNRSLAVAALAERISDAGMARLALMLVERMGTEKDEEALNDLGHAVAALAKWMKDADAAPLVERAAEVLIKHMRNVKNENKLDNLRGAVVRLAAIGTPRWIDQLFDLDAADRRNTYFFRFYTHYWAGQQPFLRALSPESAARWLNRLLDHPHVALALTSGNDRDAWATALDQLQLGNDPARFVEWLKAPTCVGLLREAVLKHAGRAAGREFRTVWEFTDWVREHHPKLDLAAPPRREP